MALGTVAYKKRQHHVMFVPSLYHISVFNLLASQQPDLNAPGLENGLLFLYKKWQPWEGWTIAFIPVAALYCLTSLSLTLHVLHLSVGDIISNTNCNWSGLDVVVYCCSPLAPLYGCWRRNPCCRNFSATFPGFVSRMFAPPLLVYLASISSHNNQGWKTGLTSKVQILDL